MKKALLIAAPVVVAAGVVGYVNRDALNGKLDEAVAGNQTTSVDNELAADIETTTAEPALRHAITMTEEGAYEAAMKALRILMRRDENLKAYADIDFPKQKRSALGVWSPLTSGNFDAPRDIYDFNPVGDRNGPPHYYILVTGLEDGYHVYQVIVHHGGKQVLTYKHSPDERDPNLPVK